MATKKTDSQGVGGSGGGSTGGPGKGTPQKSASNSAAKSAPATSKGTASPKGAAAPRSSTAAKGSAARGAAKSPSPAAGAGGARKSTAAGQPDLRSDARAFVRGRPGGWDHDEWLGFLEDLRQRGHNIEDREAIGSVLEKERLGAVLEKVPGIGAQRVRSIAERYGNVWRLKEANPDELAREAGIPRPLAERIVESIR